VVHAGLYYAPGSLKALHCVRGAALLYRFCEKRGVAHRRIGKIIFAHDAGEVAALERIAQRAEAAGAQGLEWLGAREVSRLEPALEAEAALHSPNTGIVDSHGFMAAMLADVEARGGSLVCRVAVTGIRRSEDGWALSIEGEPEPVLSARLLVNAAGLGAQALAAATEGYPEAAIPPRLLVRGCYFGYAGAVPFSRLIYPVPVPGGLGTHLTFDLAGRARFGPNVEPVEDVDYSVDPASGAHFAEAAKRIWPKIDPARLYPDYSGIRPKVAAPGGEPDFVVAGPAQHGLPGHVALFGIESPGLTSCLSLGEEVAAQLDLGS
jgi:L-2-hydroxyglutarate oxidase LhgO